MSQPVRTRLRAEDYYQLPEYEQHDLIQLIDGEVVLGMPPILKHQIVVSRIMHVLLDCAVKKGGLALTAPTEVRLDEHNVYEPDVLYIAPANLGIAQQDEKRLMGAPDLVVEVLSPSTAKHDKQQKYQAYQRHGVREYWIVDPAHEVLEVWVLGENEQFQRLGAFAKDDSVPSAVLGEDVAVTAIFGE